MLVAAFTLSNLIGAVIVLVGLYLVVTGAPAVTAAAGDGFWDIIVKIFQGHPRAGIGLVLIIIGGVFMGVDFGPVIGGSSD
jgi:hypothetical protein